MIETVSAIINSTKEVAVKLKEAVEFLEIKEGDLIRESPIINTLDEINNASLENLKLKNELNENVSARDINKDEKLKENERNKIKTESQYSDEINENIKSKAELDVYINAGLTENDVNGIKCLCKDIDLEQLDDNGLSNFERMKKGLSPLDENGEPIELHHIGQKSDSPIAELTKGEHRGEYNKILHDTTQTSEINREEFSVFRKEYWKARAEQIENLKNK